MSSAVLRIEWGRATGSLHLFHRRPLRNAGCRPREDGVTLKVEQVGRSAIGLGSLDSDRRRGSSCCEGQRAPQVVDGGQAVEVGEVAAEFSIAHTSAPIEPLDAAEDRRASDLRIGKKGEFRPAVSAPEMPFPGKRRLGGRAPGVLTC